MKTTKIEAADRLTSSSATPVVAAVDPMARKLLNQAITFITNGKGGVLAKAPDGALLAATVEEATLDEQALLNLTRIVKATKGYKLHLIPINRGKLLLSVTGAPSTPADKAAIVKDVLTGVDFKVQENKPERLKVSYDADNDDVWTIMARAEAVAKKHGWQQFQKRGATCYWRIGDNTEIYFDGNYREVTVYSIGEHHDDN